VYSTYTVDFDGQYKFSNPLEQPVTLTVSIISRRPIRSNDNFKFEINGKQVLPIAIFPKGLTATIRSTLVKQPTFK